jgi:LEA14-like dessication related protein
MKKSKMALPILLTATVIFLCAFKTGLKEPTITYEKFNVTKITFKDTTVDFIYSVNNPNPIGLKNISVDYELYLGAKETPPKDTAPTATGTDVTFDVKAKSISPFVLPMTINYVGFFQTAEKLTKVILEGQTTIPFVLKTRFKLNLKIIHFSIPVEAKGELPLPKVSSNTLEKKLF